MPGLKQALLDPVPEVCLHCHNTANIFHYRVYTMFLPHYHNVFQVRSVSARALGALVKELGEENCSDLLPWLMETLISESSSVDRSGAAQGKSLLPVCHHQPHNHNQT